MSANNKPINAWLFSLAESVPFCPCPPETSSCASKCELDEVGGGILARFELLKESVPVNGSAVPLNLE